MELLLSKIIDTSVSKPTELSPGRQAGLRQSLLCTWTHSGDKDVTMAQGQACLQRPVRASQCPSFPPETSNRKAAWPMLGAVEVHTDHYRNSLTMESSPGPAGKPTEVFVTAKTDKTSIIGPVLVVVIAEFDLGGLCLAVPL